jgi:poly-gamma-glutamate capsule biosynthesis protein CapA/YwtB (metallophosphatase superfamily)
VTTGECEAGSGDCSHLRKREAPAIGYLARGFGAPGHVRRVTEAATETLAKFPLTDNNLTAEFLVFWRGGAAAIGASLHLRERVEGAMPGRENPGKLRLFLAGDALITEAWSHIEDPGFLGLIAEMRSADAAIVNLETVIHEFGSPAQPDSGGAYMASPPEIARELRWAGIGMASAANNHAFDYGSGGILETLAHARQAGLVLAGIGADLQAARSPAYLDANGARIALVSSAASYVYYGRASRSRPDMPGRPGLNPLNLTRRRTLTVSPAMFRRLAAFMKQVESRPVAGEPMLRFPGLRIRAGEANERGFGMRLYAADRLANLSAVREAAATSRATVLAIHDHAEKPWLRSFARRALMEGADVVHVHGPHMVRGIEVVGRGVIFYGMGDFVYQPHRVSRFPAEAYERRGLGDEAGPDEMHHYVGRGGSLYERKTYEAFAARVSFDDRGIAAIRLLPLDLQFDADDRDLGRPRLADAALGRRIVEEVAGLSRRFGTRIRYEAEHNEGVVEL